MEWIEIIFPSLVALIFGAIGWFLKSGIESRRRAEESLREERATTYTDILMPFARLFVDLSEKGQKDAIQEIKSLEYRNRAFRLMLLGSDEVVQAWNQMWGIVYQIETGTVDTVDILKRFGDVLLSIRKGLGNSKTKLINKDMLKWMIKDIDTIKWDV